MLLAIPLIMSAASSSMPHPGSARLTLRALSIWPNEDGPAQQLQIPLSADKDTNACTTLLSIRRSDCNPNPWRTQPGKPSSASSMDRRPWPGSRKTGPTLWQGSRKSREAQQWRRLVGGIETKRKLRTHIPSVTEDSAGTEPRITTHVGGQSRRQTMRSTSETHVFHQVRTCFASEPHVSHPVRTCSTSCLT